MMRKTLNRCTDLRTLLELRDIVDARIDALKSSIGIGVILKDSSVQEGGDVARNSYHHSIHAHFTVGPNKANYWLNIYNEDIEGGDERTCIEGDHFTVEDGDFAGPSEEEIASFLKKAGLMDSDEVTEETSDRNKHFYARVYRDVIELIADTYGEEDSHGVPLGTVPDDMYEWLRIQPDEGDLTQPKEVDIVDEDSDLEEY